MPLTSGHRNMIQDTMWDSVLHLLNLIIIVRYLHKKAQWKVSGNHNKSPTLPVVSEQSWSLPDWEKPWVITNRQEEAQWHRNFSVLTLARTRLCTSQERKASVLLAQMSLLKYVLFVLLYNSAPLMTTRLCCTLHTNSSSHNSTNRQSSLRTAVALNQTRTFVCFGINRATNTHNFTLSQH